ncbi:MAG: tetratricopeptide repeat protein [Balneolaceae bacterium]
MIRPIATAAIGGFILFFFVTTTSFGQSGEFRMANQYMQQQKYDEALPILQELHENSPGTYTYFERLIDVLINLKRYDEAIEIAENSVQNGENINRSRIKLAELFHINDEQERAEREWAEVLDENDQNMQIFHNVASSMMDRREYDLAIDVYEHSRDVFSNETLFANEIANAYMQSGDFEKAVLEYYSVIEESPQQMSFVQQRFLRMRDDRLYSIASLELEDYLLEMEPDHAAYSQLYQLLSWLFLETEEYRRALVSARQYESRTDQPNYSLFSLGNRLRSARQYELAADAYDYYIENIPNLKTRAIEEKAITYLEWARYFDRNSLGTLQEQSNLFDEAYRLNETIVEDMPGYDRIERVLTNLIDLSLDHYKDDDKAERWYNKLNSQNNSDSDDAYSLYSEGRIALFQSDYTTARQALTRADRATDDSNLSEKARYYLSLSDFFSGDFEFAEIQLKSLERRSTSYFANNAIQLRMWIKNGLRADSTEATLNEFSNSLELVHTGRYEKAIEAVEPILESPAHPFADDLTVELAKSLPFTFAPFMVNQLTKQVEENQMSPIRERLLWERAVFAEQLTLQNDGGDSSLSNEDLFFRNQPVEEYSRTDIEQMYEKILMEFPDGFYANFSREKLQQLPDQTL